jgi:hypothetical protein
MKLYKTINVLDTSDVTLNGLYYIFINNGIVKSADKVEDGFYLVLCTYVGGDFILFTPIAKQGELFPPTKRKPFKITSENIECVLSLSAVDISEGYDKYDRWTLQIKEHPEMYNP